MTTDLSRTSVLLFHLPRGGYGYLSKNYSGPSFGNLKVFAGPMVLEEQLITDIQSYSNGMNLEINRGVHRLSFGITTGDTIEQPKWDGIAVKCLDLSMCEISEFGGQVTFKKLK